jgi:hypothetical protein
MKTHLILTLAGVFLAISCCSVSAGTYSGGTGEPNDPFRIATAEDLNDIGNHIEDFNKYFVMVADIDLSDYTGTEFSIIGNDSDVFAGVFDGNGFEISNFTYDSNGVNYIGLFGYVDGPNAVIKNLGLVDCNIAAGTGWHVGALVGWNQGGTISNCYSIGNVKAQDHVGGLVGTNYHSSIITRCFATGSVTGKAGVRGFEVGGLVGDNYEGMISNCYTTGNVKGRWDVGGMLGFNAYGTIVYCYATGKVEGEQVDRVGGLVGDRMSGSISYSFWDTQTTEQATSDGGTGKTTAEMKRKTTFTNWDFVETWGIEDGQTYPFLKLSYPVGDINLDGGVDFVDFAYLAEHWLEGI